jgi:anti-sigma factor RsiW
MSTSHGALDSHDEAFEMIPWLVNGRLSPEERDQLERHLAKCGDCRREVEVQQRLRQEVRRDQSNVEYAPHASFQKLWLRIEQSPQGDSLDEGVDRGASGGARSPAVTRTWERPRRWMMAAGTVLAVGLGLFAAMQWRASSPDRAPEYRTASAPPAQPDRAGQIRVVFAPNVTVDELTRIASETRLTIVAGPSDSGVYTLAVQPGMDVPVADAIVRLRSDPRVRFAEPVVAASRGAQ